MRSHSMLLTVVTMSLAACTWVKPTAESERVRLADSAGVASCNRIGTITTRVKDRIGFIARSPEKVRGELATLARLEAVDMGADTVVAEGPVSEGHRNFSAWDCP